jgi:hypothetical protein
MSRSVKKSSGTHSVSYPRGAISFKFVAMRGLLLLCFIGTRPSEYAVYDWVRLGVFPGSRISECAPSASHRSAHTTPCGTIPVSCDAGPWSGQALAFIAANFTFYSQDFTLLDHKFRLLNTIRDHVFEAHIRFCFKQRKFHCSQASMNLHGPL